MLPPEADLEVISCLPEDDAGARPVLFVHGAYCDAWCWGVNFLPWFAGREHPAYALSLRGHGRSGGRETLLVTSLDDYVNDVLRALRMITENHGRPAMLVGHSMGAAIVERLIENHANRPYWHQAALLAPVPPMGLLPSTARLLALQPDFLWHVQQVTVGGRSAESLNALREHYFTPAVPLELLVELTRHIHPESPRAVMDLSLPFSFPLHDAYRVNPQEILVVGGERDAIFTPEQVAQTGARYGVEPVIVPRLPHMLMLEPGWEAVAARIQDKLAESEYGSRVVPLRRRRSATG